MKFSVTGQENGDL